MDLLSHVIPSLAEGLFLFNREGRLVLLNPSAERIVGRSAKAVVGQGVTEVFPDGGEVEALLVTALTDGRAVYKSGVELAGTEGKPLFLTVSVSPVETPDGEVLGAAVLARDETLQRELDRSFRRTDQLSSVGALNLGMAHEIKNPLGGIKGAAWLLRTEIPEGSPLVEHCDVILREVGRIDELVESLLSTVRRGPGRFSEVNIHEVLNEVSDLVSRSEEARGLDFVRLYDPSLPAIQADRNGLAQVFLNLLKNAVEASPPECQITVRTFLPVASAVTGTRSGMLEVDIQDEGPGFDDAVKDSAAPFFTTKPKGVGLGLAISEQIVHNHGGSLILENGEDGGALVRVLLPLGGINSQTET